MNTSESNARPMLAAAVVLAGLAWAVSWGFNGQTADGSLTVLGLSEGGWRAILNPALGVLLVAALAWVRIDPHPTRMALLLGFGILLAGNLLEFGLVGRPTPLAAVGPYAFAVGAGLAVAGLSWTIARGTSAATGRRAIGIGAGSSLAFGMTVIAVAVPPAAALALFPLVDALVQRTARPTSAAVPFGSPSLGGAATPA
jgi:hypothetical protein